jgi:predicted Zn-dependent protease
VSEHTSGLPPAPDVIELALSLDGDDGRVVIIGDSSDADVRFANNTTTTNGVRQARRVTVVSFCANGEGVAAGSATQSGDVDVTALVKRAQKDAQESPPATDASPLLEGREDPGYGEPPLTTDLSVMSGVLDDLAAAFKRARSSDRVLAGFAEHGMETVYLGTSTGLRRRHAQPTGALQLVGRSTDGARSAWVGAGTADFSDVSIASFEEQVIARLAWAQN